jgi:hypothetical protein
MKKKKTKLEDLRGGDAFVLREEVEKDACVAFVKIPPSPYYNSFRLCDGRPCVFSEDIEVIKLKLK